MNKLLLGLALILAIVTKHSAVGFPLPHSEGKVNISLTVKGLESAKVRLDTLSGELDSAGTVEFELPLAAARYVELQVKDRKLTLFAEPVKDIHIYFVDGKIDETIRFTGENAAVNEFLYGQRAVSQRFNQYFNSRINSYLSKLPEKQYVAKMDSLQSTFLNPLAELAQDFPGTNKDFIRDYRTEIELLFLSFLADYPLLHQKNTGKTVKLSKRSRGRLKAVNLNDPALHKYSSTQRLVRNFLYREITDELARNDYTSSDNQRLDAGFAVIRRAFTNQEVYDKVLHGFLLNHIENLGVKNIDNNVADFNALCRNKAFKEEINTLYREALTNREGHLIRTYKKVGGYRLDAHIFLPDSLEKDKKYPVIAMFHGGSFFEGKPDWFFSSCERYAKRGWVAVAVEYRVADRHGNLLPDAIADGKSLVRYLRANADELHIDTSKVMATGNSAGATIALALATLDGRLDKPTESKRISSRPNAVMANAALADLTGSGHHWWHKHYNADFIEDVSPLHQVKEGLPPMLLVHGTDDNSVDISSVRQFAERANELGNPVEYHELKGAPHMIWRIPYFSRQVERYRQEFIEKLGWE